MLYRALLLSVAANCVLVLCVIFFASSNHALVLCTQFGVCVVLVLVATNVPSLYEVRKINPVVARESEIHHQLGGVLTGSFRFFFFFFFFFFCGRPRSISACSYQYLLQTRSVSLRTCGSDCSIAPRVQSRSNCNNCQNNNRRNQNHHSRLQNKRRLLQGNNQVLPWQVV